MNKTELDKIGEALKEKMWVKRGKWHQTVIMHEIYGEGEATSFQKKLGYPFERSREIIYKDDFFDLEDEWEKIRKTIRNEYQKDHNYLFNYAEDCLNRGWQLLEESNKYPKMNFHKMDNNELAGHYKDLVNACKAYMPFMFSLHLFDDFLTDQFNNLLTEYIENNNLSRDDYYSFQNALTLPDRKIFVLEEKEELLKIAAGIQKKVVNDNHRDELIRAHTKKYAWIGIANLEAPPYSQAYFMEKLNECLEYDANSELQKSIHQTESLQNEQKRFLDKIGESTDLYVISKVIQKFGFLRSFRVDALYITYYRGWGMVEEMAKRLNLTKQLDLTYLSSDEVKDALSNKTNYHQLIKQRSSDLLSIMIGDRRYELTGADAEAVLPYIDFPKAEIKDFVRGSVAFPGIVTGPCKVLHSTSEIKKVERGDIIVISMTDPNYISAMEKAAAFVTDQGGILCHAAIVSREMKKPCVIGTKLATVIFKDGDIVEVDANTGTVKLVK